MPRFGAVALSTDDDRQFWKSGITHSVLDTTRPNSPPLRSPRKKSKRTLSAFVHIGALHCKRRQPWRRSAPDSQRTGGVSAARGGYLGELYTCQTQKGQSSSPQGDLSQSDMYLPLAFLVPEDDHVTSAGNSITTIRAVPLMVRILFLICCALTFSSVVVISHKLSIQCHHEPLLAM